MMKKLSIILAAMALTLSACKETDQDKVADAQDCLDNASMASAQQCVDMVEGIESKGAYLIRCSAMFIQEGFMDASRLSNAMDQISGGGGASDSMEMMAVLAFSQFGGAAANEAAANQAVSYCDQAGSKGLVMLASLSSIATTSVNLGIGGGDAADIENGLQQIAAGAAPAQATAVGSAAAAAYDANCSGDGGSFGQFCDQFESVIDSMPPGYSAEDLGEQLAICYTNPAALGCSGF